MDKINHITLSTDNLYLKCMEIYKISKNDQDIPEVEKFSWRKFKYLIVKKKERNYQLKVQYRAYNVVTSEMEMCNQTYNFDDDAKRDEQFNKFVEQAKMQDPSTRYAEDALMEALKQ